jgi:hypothetical protein
MNSNSLSDLFDFIDVLRIIADFRGYERKAGKVVVMATAPDIRWEVFAAAKDNWDD